MRYLVFRLTIAVILFFGHEIISQNPDVTVEKQSIQVEIIPDSHQANVQVALQYRKSPDIKTITFLLNKDIEKLSITQYQKPLDFEINRDFNLSAYGDTSDTLNQSEYTTAMEVKVNVPQQMDRGSIALQYTLMATDEVDQAAFSREYIAYQVNAYIGDRGVFISPGYFWYPTIPGNLSHFDVTTITPDTLQILTQGRLAKELVEEGKRHTQWIVEYPANSLHLVGSKYGVQKTTYNNEVDIYTYFFPESQELAQSYLDACHRYVALYERLIGPYPFSKFAVVENFFPTGYGMPSYTLLGSQVIRLPFIIYTSLGHEIAHNWWGNSVYVNYESGNWCEGITTYFADHYYKEQKSAAEAVNYRRDICRDFSVYVKDQKDFPLNQFTERTESSSRAIGYGKSAMVFHQLRKIVGDSLFFESFRTFYRDHRFTEASWQDIETAAEKTTGMKLGWYFDQWIENKGAPQVELEAATFNDKKVEISLKQNQDQAYRLYVPVEILLPDSTIMEEAVWLEKAEQSYKFEVPVKPLRVAVDPDFDFLRKLQRSEIPPSLSEIYAEEQAVYVLPDKTDSTRLAMYRTFANTMIRGENQDPIILADEITDEQLGHSSIYIFGNPSENSIFQKIKLLEQAEFSIGKSQITLNSQAVPGPDEVAVLGARFQNSEKNACIITIGENGETGRVANLLSHYGKYSYLVFSNGKNQVKEIYTVDKSPMVYTF